MAQGTQATGWCAIGSVKSNIGHAESAAGIAGVTKVLLQMQYGELVPSLHSEVLNPHIDFSTTPFVVQQELTEWKRTQIPETGEGKELPRRAGISSFGAGGSNAHVILEEYVEGHHGSSHRTGATHNSDGGRNRGLSYPVLIILSTRTEEQLHERVQQLLAWIQDGRCTEDAQELCNLAYTLQVGREAMEERLALQVNSLQELEEKLRRYVEGRHEGSDWYRGQAKRYDAIVTFAADEDGQKAVAAWMSKGKYEKLLSLWARGLHIDWKLLYTVETGSAQGTIPTAPVRPRRISLPTYPFARERYWLPVTTVGMERGSYPSTTSETSPQPTGHAALHPLVQRNTSVLWEQRFCSTFHGEEFFLTDHVISGQRIMPGVAYLEMACVAVAVACGLAPQGGLAPQVGADAMPEQSHLHLSNIIWVRPLVCDSAHPTTVCITLSPQENGTILFVVKRDATACDSCDADDQRQVPIVEIQQEGETTEIVYCQGIVQWYAEDAVGSVESQSLDLFAIQARCPQQISAAECYQRYRELGLSYGPTFQVIEQLSIGEEEVLARLCLPAAIATQTQMEEGNEPPLYTLHPCILDAALQACIGLQLEPNGYQELQVPFALEALEIMGVVPAQGWAWVRRRSRLETDLVFDIEVCDDEGRIAVRLHGLRTRTLIGGEEARTVLLTPDWKEGVIPEQEQAPPLHLLEEAPPSTERLVLLCGLPNIEASRLQAQMTLGRPSGGVQVHHWSSSQPRRDQRCQDAVVQLIQEIQRLLQSRQTVPTASHSLVMLTRSSP